jgi:hypothetical protein
MPRIRCDVCGVVSRDYFDHCGFYLCPNTSCANRKQTRDDCILISEDGTRHILFQDRPGVRQKGERASLPNQYHLPPFLCRDDTILRRVGYKGENLILEVEEEGRTGLTFSGFPLTTRRSFWVKPLNPSVDSKARFLDQGGGKWRGWTGTACVLFLAILGCYDLGRYGNKLIRHLLRYRRFQLTSKTGPGRIVG